MRPILLLALIATSKLAPAQGTDKIEVSYDKSSILVFESPIKPRGWNCGLKELVGVSVLENKILLQSKEEHFEETNLIVELVDGSMYAFDLVYNNNPKKTFHVIKSDKTLYTPSLSGVSKVDRQNDTAASANVDSHDAASVISQNKNSDSPETGAQKVLAAPDYLKRIGMISRKMYLFIGGIYVFGNRIYFKVNLKNVSTVPYDVDYAQFLIKNRKGGLNKTSSASAEQIEPLLIYNPAGATIGQNQVVTFVYVFDKFTISDDKKLHLEFWERNGDRSLELPVESIEILNAKNEL